MLSSYNRGCHSLSLCHTQDVKRQEEAARKEEEAKRLQEQETEMKAAVEAVQEKRAQIRAEHRRAMKRLQAQEILMTRSLKGDDKMSRAREGLESIPRDMYKGKPSTAVAMALCCIPHCDKHTHSHDNILPRCTAQVKDQRSGWRCSSRLT